MKLTSETKLFLGIIIATIAIIGGAIALLSKPDVTFSKTDLITSSVPTRGNPNAKAWLVEFSDFQCPACKAAQPTVDALVKQYPDTLLFAYRHFPLDQHPFAQKAAEAAEAAHAQGKFWEMHDLLFANQEKFSDSIFTELAKQINLDIPTFEKALAEGTYKQRVLDDKAYGSAIGIQATPTFFLNGKKLNLASYDELKTAVADAVK